MHDCIGMACNSVKCEYNAVANPLSRQREGLQLTKSHVAENTSEIYLHCLAGDD